jgi:ATP-dependent Lhr-like helicase
VFPGRSLSHAPHARRQLATTTFRDEGQTVRVLTWLGDSANEALACFLTYRGRQAFHSELGVEVRKGPDDDLDDIVAATLDLGMAEVPAPSVLLEGAKNLRREKWDWVLPAELLANAYVRSYLDIDEALAWVRQTAAAE